MIFIDTNVLSELMRVDPDTVEQEILAIRRACARAALSRTRERARSEGLDRLTGLPSVDCR